jgi:hypothetical protein
MSMSSLEVQHTPSTPSSDDQQSSTPSQFFIPWWMWLYLTLHLPPNTSKPIQSVSAAIAPPSRSTASKYTSNYPQSQPQSAFFSSHDLSLHGHVQTCLIIAFQCISEFAQSGSPTVSPKSLNHHLQKHLLVHWISVTGVF